MLALAHLCKKHILHSASGCPPVPLHALHNMHVSFTIVWKSFTALYSYKTSSQTSLALSVPLLMISGCESFNILFAFKFSSGVACPSWIFVPCGHVYFIVCIRSQLEVAPWMTFRNMHVCSRSRFESFVGLTALYFSTVMYPWALMDNLYASPSLCQSSVASYSTSRAFSALHTSGVILTSPAPLGFSCDWDTIVRIHEVFGIPVFTGQLSLASSSTSRMFSVLWASCVVLTSSASLVNP